MFNKILLTSFMSASLLISTCSAMDETPTLNLSVKKLQRGYEAGTQGQPLELNNGTKWEVKNLGHYTPNFDMVYDKKQKFAGVYSSDQQYFRFEHSTPGHSFQKWNEETQKYEYENFPGTDFFDLSVKQIIEEKALVLKTEEKAPQQFLTFNGMQIPCVWNPETNKLELDFGAIPQLANLMNIQFNTVQHNNSEIEEEKPSVLQIEDSKEPKIKIEEVKIEEIKKDEVIEQNNSSNSKIKEEKPITDLSLTFAQLEQGFTTGNLLVLEDGTTWTVTNASPWMTPMFTPIYYMPNISGYYDQYNDQFTFSYTEAGGFEMKWNEQTREWEPDYDKPQPGVDYFNLIVKRAK